MCVCFRPDLDRSFSDTSDFRFDQGPLRSVLIPGAMIDQFIRIAQPNTSADKETCGLLMGKMVRGEEGKGRMVRGFCDERDFQKCYGL